MKYAKYPTIPMPNHGYISGGDFVIDKQTEREAVHSYEQTDTDRAAEADRLRSLADKIDEDIEQRRRERCMELAVAEQQPGNLTATAKEIYNYIYGGN